MLDFFHFIDGNLVPSKRSCANKFAGTLSALIPGAEKLEKLCAATTFFLGFQIANLFVSS